MSSASETRSYSQGRRAETTAATERAILDAAVALFREGGEGDPSLARVAERAGCSTRSILRHFGSKERLIEAAIADATAAVAETRRVAPGDAEGAVRKLVDHYEESGDEVVRWLADAERFPLARQVTESGSAMHRGVVAETFAPDLEGLAPARRKARIAALATVTDVHVWQLLRRREGLGRAATEAAILALVEAARRTPETEAKGSRHGGTGRSPTAARNGPAGARARKR